MQTNQTNTYRKTASQQFDFGKPESRPEQRIEQKQEYKHEYKQEYKQDLKQERSEKPESYAPAHVMPIKSFKSGAIQVSIWENESLGQDNIPKTFKTVSFDRRYKDKSGVWKSTNSLRVNDLPRAVLILNKAYEYLILTESSDDVEA